MTFGTCNLARNKPAKAAKAVKDVKSTNTLYKNTNKTVSAIILSDDQLRNYMGENSDEVSALYPKIHPITGKTIYERGFFWDNEENSEKFNKIFKNMFWEIDKEYVNPYNVTGSYKIIIHSSELHKISTVLKGFDIILYDKWLMAPEGYYWKYISIKCNNKICCDHTYEWYELEPIYY